tara:strand:- start:16972 stop:18093 length:1122 start_codon:yes stop_codon:yes gene_type:complete
MPMFKPKNTKKIIITDKTNTTLDTKHKEIMDKFKEYDTSEIPKLKLQIKKEKNNLLKKNITIEEKLDIKDKIKSINNKINSINKEKNNYFLDNSKYIYKYFENKKKIAQGKNKTTILNKFFNIDKANNNKNEKEITDIQKYLTNVDDSFLNINNFIYQKDICSHCNNGEMISIEHEGLLVCNNCSICIRFLVENEKPSYKEPPKEVCFYAYKRINHFREIIAQFQAKETTQIPEIVLENIKLQIKKERINLSQITNKKAKEILKKLGYNKYYEHIPFIKDKLGIKPPIMSSELEDTLCNLFMDIQGPYAKYCPDDRVNFLNYYYTVYKLCELLDQKQFLPYFPMLKDREKRIEQDEIWKQICKELNWEFIPTI